MKPDTDDRESLLGFLGFFETPSKDGFLAAILVTDIHGVPQEFRCTHPVKPTAVQKLLYGKTLEHQIGVVLCGEPLIEVVKNKPALIVVNKDFLLDVRIKSYSPVVFVRRAGEALEIAPSEGADKVSRRERIFSSTGKFQPIVVDYHPYFGDDMSQAGRTLEQAFAYLDPIEPFERMQKAVELLGKQSKWFE